MAAEIVPSVAVSEDNMDRSDSRRSSGGGQSSSGVRSGTGSGTGSSNGDKFDPAGVLDSVPRRVGKYKILAQLGRGGMANVFLAVAKGVGGVNKLVVLKALLPEMASDPDSLAMFLDEARLAAQLNHANVVQTYDVGTEGDRHVIVMEYLEGQSLWNVLKRGATTDQPMSLQMQLRIVSGALEGLHYAHELRSYDGTPLELVHRDISPQNIFLTYDGQVKVLDFGIAKATSSSTQTATGILKGKIAYMAPEQIMAESIDRRADVFSVGCILWQIAAGRKLWHGLPDVQLMRHVMESDIPSPQTVNPNCNDELTRIVMKALECDLERRYATALDLQADLDEYCKRFEAPVTAKQIGAYVANLFADRRAEIRAIVEHQLTILTQQGADVAGDLPSLTEDYGQAPSASNQRNGTDAGRPSRRWWPWGIGAAALALMPLAYKALQPPPAPVIIDAPATSLPPPTESIPSHVTIQFSAQPAHARLYLDDQPLPSNPTSKVLAADDAIHSLRVEADGYEKVVAEFTASRDDSLDIVLSKLPAPEPEASAKPPSTRPVSKPRLSKPTPAPAPKPDCSAPFIIDAKGIKRVRPECL